MPSARTDSVAHSLEVASSVTSCCCRFSCYLPSSWTEKVAGLALATARIAYCLSQEEKLEDNLITLCVMRLSLPAARFFPQRELCQRMIAPFRVLYQGTRLLVPAARPSVSPLREFAVTLFRSSLGKDEHLPLDALHILLAVLISVVDDERLADSRSGIAQVLRRYFDRQTVVPHHPLQVLGHVLIV